MTRKGEKRIGQLAMMIILWAGLLFTQVCVAGEIDLPEGGTLQAQDTILLKDFTAVYYIKCDSEGHRWSIGNVLIIYKNNQEVMTIDEGGASIANICELLTPASAGYVEVPEYDEDGALTSYTYVKKSDTCYYRDINNDSIDEIIIDIFTGGANCCFTTRVYALKDSLEELLNFDAIAHGSSLVDIENDSIPEFITWDNEWTGWRSDYTSWKAYLPQIIWRWNGYKYRVANFRFADYLIKLLDLDSYKIPSNDSTRKPEDFYEENLWGFMINNYYAGRADLADSIFNACWPAQDTMKLKLYEQFQQRLRWSEYWPQVLESKW
jgi:hypothetical protein